MKGWKTWTGALGGVGAGVSIAAAGLLSEPVEPDKVYQGLVIICGAIGLIGVGHKIEKTKE